MTTAIMDYITSYSFLMYHIYRLFNLKENITGILFMCILITIIFERDAINLTFVKSKY